MRHGLREYRVFFGTINPHDTLAHYELRELLGEGGMGEVWLAHDQRLDRPVALKLLRGAEGVERYVLEARAASALNHPNVAHIYEIGQQGDVVWIAMEYVEGATLESRVARGALPLDEVIDLATQLADALSEAHAKGIVHRDLKPANIVINARGQAKILDFGIARMTREPRLSTTTEPNVVVGTVPYMSPEQARGKDVDPRSDQFAFGVIVYEMLSGRRPFDGEGVLDTLRRIAEEEPERIETPLWPVIARCLEKAREKRYPTPRELLADLRVLSRDQLPVRRSRGYALAAVAILAIVLAIVLFRREKPAPPPTLTKITAAPGLEDEPALSPDGQSIAYTSDERGNLDIFVRRIAGGDAVRITDSDADDAQPAWSPDGKRIAFVSARERNWRLSIVLSQALGNYVNAQGGDLFVTSASGGAAVRLVANAFYPAWSPDGAWIVFMSGRGGRWDLWKVRASGGEPVQVTSDSDFDYQPSWSPDGKSIVYASGTPDRYVVKIVGVDVGANGRAPRTITDGKDGVLLRPVFASDAKSVIYASQRGGSMNLWQLALRARSTPQRLTLGEGDDVNPSVGASGRRIVYATVRQMPDLWTIHLASGKAEQLTFDTGREEFPDRARNGTLVFSSDRGGTDALWFRDASGTLRQFLAKKFAGQPRWSPDGTKIAYRWKDEREVTHTSVCDVASGATRFVARNAEVPAWSRDGRYLAISSWAAGPKGQIVIVDLSREDMPRRQLTQLDLTTSYPSWSPDGKSICFQATRDDGTRHIWLADVATGAVRPLTSGASEDSHPQWSPVDPDRILFVRNHENLMTVRVSTGKIEPLTQSSEPNTVLDYPSWSRDGTRVDYSLARKRGDLYLLDLGVR